MLKFKVPEPGFLLRRGLLVLWLSLLGGCGTVAPPGYEPREGDVLFQSLPHAPLVDAIEGITQSPYSHCGMVVRRDGQWRVIEAIGPVRETALREWIGQGRGRWFAAYRLEDSFNESIPRVISEGRRYLGRPYDIHYDFDDERIYCSELVFKAVRAATGRAIGRVQRIGELNWRPHEAFIRSIEDRVPLDRELISSRALSEAKELRRVFVAREPQGGG